MSTPKIEKFRNTGTDLIATINGKEYLINTFRETLWLQGLVYTHEELKPDCEPQCYFSIPGDEDSDLMWLDSSIRDFEVAGWMKAFAEGKLPVGVLR